MSGRRGNRRGPSARALARGALRRVVTPLPDRVVEAVFAHPLAVRASVATLARSLSPAHADGFAGSIVLELEREYGRRRGRDAWTLTIGDGRARSTRGSSPEADTAVRLPAALFVRLLAGERDVESAFGAGSVEVRGPLLVAARLPRMLSAG
jgi:putative sterol carrier protein